MLNVLELLGHPEKNYRTIHIAGTNGKGSVSTKIASALQAAGYKTGLFTSPHISSFRERIQINGELITEQNVVEHLKQIQALSYNLTFFETVTLMAFLHFSEQQVDYAVIETGIGGRKDATNCILPAASVITSIGFDHMEILGSTIEAITYEKAGIIKEGTPLVIGPTVPKTVISAIKSDFIAVQGPFSTFDEENSAIAKAALAVLEIPQGAIMEGCNKRPPCRIQEVIKDTHPIILDVAHNPEGLKALFRSLDHRHPGKTFAAIVGLSSSKDIKGCLEVLIQYASHLYLVQAEHRGCPVKILTQELKSLNFDKFTTCHSIKEIIQTHDGPLVICGTFFIMRQAQEALGILAAQDPVELNEPVAGQYFKGSTL